jgi:hypothetical protein
MFGGIGKETGWATLNAMAKNCRNLFGLMLCEVRTVH